MVHSLRKTSLIYVILFSFLFLYLFAVYDIKYQGPDSPIYFAYTASVVNDGDLNAVNNIYEPYVSYIPSLTIGVSESYNLPDHHTHGGVVLWAPFYMYGKSFYSVVRHLKPKNTANYSFKKIINCVMSFSTVIFGSITLALTFMFCRRFFSRRIALWSALAVFFGTPFF